MIGALLKALLTLIFIGTVMRAVRALTGGGSKPEHRRARDEARPHATTQSAPAGDGETPQKPPVRREDIIDVPYEDS